MLLAVVVVQLAMSGPSSAKSASAHGAPIKIGVICSCSGPFAADIAAAADVSRAWAKSLNASGGIDGHKVQLIVDDDGSNPGTSAADLRALVADHVDVIVDETILDAAWASAAQAANVPVVGGNFSGTPYYTNPDFYPSGQTNDSIVYANVVTAKKAGAKTLADFYCAEAPQCAQSVPLIRAAGAQLGVRDVADASISATAPNYTAQCVAAQQAHAQALFIGDSASIIVRVGADCTKQGYDPAYITEGTGFSTLLSSAPGTRTNLWSDYPILPFFANKAPVKAMDKVVDRYYPGLRNNPNNWSEYAAQAWTAGLLIQDAVKASGLGPHGTPSAAEIRKGLDSLKGDTLDGWSPPLTFKAGKPHPVDCWFTARVHNGQASLVDGGKLTCEKGASS